MGEICVGDGGGGVILTLCCTDDDDCVQHKVHKVPINSGHWQVLALPIVQRADEDGARKKLPLQEKIINFVFITPTLSLIGQDFEMLQNHLLSQQSVVRYSGFIL